VPRAINNTRALLLVLDYRNRILKRGSPRSGDKTRLNNTKIHSSAKNASAIWLLNSQGNEKEKKRDREDDRTSIEAKLGFAAPSASGRKKKEAKHRNEITLSPPCRDPFSLGAS